jgi:phospholipase C
MAVIVLTYDENGGYWDHVAAAFGRRLGRPAGARARASLR